MSPAASTAKARAAVTGRSDLERQRREQALDAALAGVRQETLCELLDTSRKIVREWEAAGLPHRGVGKAKRYDLPAVLGWLQRRMEADDDPETMTKRRAEIKLLVEREASAEARRRLLDAKYISVEEIRRREARQQEVLEYSLEALIRQMTPQVLALGPEPTLDDIENVIKSHVAALLRAMSGGQ